MDAEVFLFVLRLLSGLILFLMLALLLIVMWRDYRTAASEVEASRRIYGQLVEMKEINGTYIVTGSVYPLLALTSLGRGPTNAVSVNDNFASGEHALVALRSGQWWLEDRHSRNGTTLNEVTINRPVIVTDGDIIGIGNTRFRLDLEQKTWI